MLGSNRNRAERSDDSEAQPRWRVAPDTRGDSMITVTGGSKRPGTEDIQKDIPVFLISVNWPDFRFDKPETEYHKKEKYLCAQQVYPLSVFRVPNTHSQDFRVPNTYSQDFRVPNTFSQDFMVAEYTLSGFTLAGCQSSRISGLRYSEQPRFRKYRYPVVIHPMRMSLPLVSCILVQCAEI